MDTPCHKCEHSGCGLRHNSCPEYLRFVKESKDRKEKERQAAEIRYAVRDGIGRMKTKNNGYKVIKSRKK